MVFDDKNSNKFVLGNGSRWGISINEILLIVAGFFLGLATSAGVAMCFL